MSAPLIADEAALWMARSRDPRFVDWDGLTDWLEQDPAHNVAYEAAFAAHDLAGTTPPTPLVSDTPARQTVRNRWPLWGGTAAAAAAVALATIGLPGLAPAPERIIATKAGEQRTVRLDDGTTIAMSGATRIALGRNNGRSVRIETGEAMFDVVHDETRPFTVDVDGRRLVDIGTRFDVIRTAGRAQVAVAEGAVLYDPAGAAVRLNGGRMLRKRDGSDIVEIADVSPAEVGAWRQHHLVYHDAPLREVAEDYGRLSGVHLSVAPEIAARSFTGAIRFDPGSPADQVARLGRILDVEFSHRGNDWLLSSGRGAGR